MNVYVESNFVLELALLQEQAASCETLLGLSASDQVNLIVPAYSLAEPYETLTRRRKDRIQVKRTVDVELRQLARTDTYTERLSRFDDITALLISSADEEQRRLEDVLLRIAGVADVIALDSDTIVEAMRRQKENDFSAQDAIVYTSVVNDLRTRPTEHGSCFLNRNSKDFDDQNVVEELANWDCTLFPRFDSGLDFVRSRLD